MRINRSVLLLILIFTLGLAQGLYASSEVQDSDEEILETGEGGELQQEYSPPPSNDGKVAIPHFKENKNLLEELQTPSQPLIAGSKAKVIALNKTTAKSSEITLKLGDTQYFGNIEIKIHKCFKSLDPYLLDNKILLTLTEHKIDEDPIIIFQGWMMSSNLSISTLEHPVYEVFAKDCW